MRRTNAFSSYADNPVVWSVEPQRGAAGELAHLSVRTLRAVVIQREKPGALGHLDDRGRGRLNQVEPDGRVAARLSSDARGGGLARPPSPAPNDERRHQYAPRQPPDQELTSRATPGAIGRLGQPESRIGSDDAADRAGGGHACDRGFLNRERNPPVRAVSSSVRAPASDSSSNPGPRLELGPLDSTWLSAQYEKALAFSAHSA